MPSPVYSVETRQIVEPENAWSARALALAAVERRGEI
jgi:hypothetical protein